ncbi:MAG: prepilin-type N-terminal cleavage/methylation domain-containing protein [Phycisphaeraceae bacterium]|nr:prepilin-type N-terminal cleavage/methylation domain-containing protein [Phycisphaeraceae bacterium]
MHARYKTNPGFTLIELLVVIAIIAVLMGILMPALRAVKQQAASINCMANCRSLSTAWFMYAGDNEGRIVPAQMREFDTWIGTPKSVTGTLYTSQQTTPVVEDEDEIRGIEAGLIYKYVEDAGVYHCPADNIRISVHDQTKVFATYALPACLNGWPVGGNPQITNIDKIKSPSTKYNFIESAETRNFNMNGRFVMGAPEYTGSPEWKWWGPMAVNHNKGSVLGFCDGHAEKHVWVNKFTLERVDKVMNQGGGNYGQQPAEEGQTEDIEYMAKGWAYEQK